MRVFALSQLDDLYGPTDRPTVRRTKPFIESLVRTKNGSFRNNFETVFFFGHGLTLNAENKLATLVLAYLFIRTIILIAEECPAVGTVAWQLARSVSSVACRV